MRSSPFIAVLMLAEAACATGPARRLENSSKTLPTQVGRSGEGADPYPPQVRPCLDAYGQVQPPPRAIMGTVEFGTACAISIVFEDQRALDDSSPGGSNIRCPRERSPT